MKYTTGVATTSWCCLDLVGFFLAMFNLKDGIFLERWNFVLMDFSSHHFSSDLPALRKVRFSGAVAPRRKLTPKVTFSRPSSSAFQTSTALNLRQKKKKTPGGWESLGKTMGVFLWSVFCGVVAGRWLNYVKLGGHNCDPGNPK